MKRTGPGRVPPNTAARAVLITSNAIARNPPEGLKKPLK